MMEAVLGGPSVRQASIAERGTAPRRGRAGLSRSWSSRKEKSARGPGGEGNGGHGRSSFHGEGQRWELVSQVQAP